jgi:hypothetical protein
MYCAHFDHEFAETVMPASCCGTGILARPGERAVRLRRLVFLIGIAAGLSACSQDIETTPEQRACIAEHYSNYNPRQISQCVDVCRLCMKGNTVTCNTSCRLRGAS